MRGETVDTPSRRLSSAGYDTVANARVNGAAVDGGCTQSGSSPTRNRHYNEAAK